jgi:hypothetical protein
MTEKQKTLDELLTALAEENKEKTQKKVSSSGFAKILTIGIVILFVIFGVIGSFWSDFNMDKFTSFISTFSPIMVTLVGSVGVGLTTKTITNFLQKEGEENDPSKSTGK